MALHSLKLIIEMADYLEEMIRNQCLLPVQNGHTIGLFNMQHFLDALLLVYEQPAQRLMTPVRASMARLTDRVIMWILSHPATRSQLTSPAWERFLPLMQEDRDEYRRFVARTGPTERSVLPDMNHMETVMQEAEGPLTEFI